MVYFIAVLAGIAAGEAWGESAGWAVFFALVIFCIATNYIGATISEALEGLKDDDWTE